MTPHLPAAALAPPPPPPRPPPHPRRRLPPPPPSRFYTSVLGMRSRTHLSPATRDHIRLSAETAVVSALLDTASPVPGLIAILEAPPAAPGQHVAQGSMNSPTTTRRRRGSSPATAAAALEPGAVPASRPGSVTACETPGPL
ncbi:hypothetical protein BDA96_02G130100 [Sorghum bicolor]|uniref:Uncharacterized protein n=2 Tax=Sorghum bicolor TaxID=4558 RepID=A0A921RNH1_SORBI|nr:hypothetical protein BDA96_02G130100 [Sorghum bicolor]OQU88935.1 hypothetical protein SORBI_3002G123750 [Sorghum bicolor]